MDDEFLIQQFFCDRGIIRGSCTSSLNSKDCNLERNADLTLGGSPWYNASLVLGGTELGRET